MSYTLDDGKTQQTPCRIYADDGYKEAGITR